MSIDQEISPRLYQQIADRIAASIHQGKFGIGARLPAERDLADQFEVSRPTVREALIALEIAGLVEVRTGSGTYVSPRARSEASTKEASKDAGPSAFEIIEARRAIEPSMAAQAAVKATKEDVKLITEALAEFERHWDGTHWEKLEADRMFHMRVAEAAHNPLIVKILEGLWDGMFGQIFAVLSQRTKLSNRQAMTMQDHHTILYCIERKDGSGAYAAMTNHLVHVELTLLERQPSEAQKRNKNNRK
jgi:DNA-binding FadR family transcriptional regulator